MNTNIIKMWTLLIAFLLIQSISYCQNGYPKQQVIDRDTITSFTSIQVKTLYRNVLQYQNCTQDVIQLKKRQTKSDSAIKYLQKTIASDSNTLVDYSNITNTYKSEVLQDENTINADIKIRSKLTTQRNIFVGSTGILLIVLIIRLIK